MYLQRMNRANGTQARERNLRDVGTQDGLRSWRFFSRIHKDSMGVSGSLPFKMVISWYLLWILKKFRVISPPARWGLLDFIRVVLLLLLLLFLLLLLLHHLHHLHHLCLPPCQLFAKLFANFRTQWALLDLNCKGLSALGTAPAEFSEHRWTSTWDLPSSVSTAGPQPGTRRAQWAPLDLNLGPSELSEHRWTSTTR